MTQDLSSSPYYPWGGTSPPAYDTTRFEQTPTYQQRQTEVLRQKSQETPQPGLPLLDWIDKPRQAIVGGLASLLGTQGTNWTDILRNKGLPELGRAQLGPLDFSGRDVLGLGLDIVSDPLTYVGGALLKGAGGAIKAIPRAIPGAARAAETVTPRAGEAMAQRLAGHFPPAGITEPITELPERAGNILLSKFSPEEVRQELVNAYRAHPDVMEAARRGTMSIDQIQSLADDIGVRAGDLIVKWKPGTAYNPEQIAALKTFLQEKTRKVVELIPAARGGGDEAVGAFHKARLDQALAQEAFSGGAAEWGRTGLILRQKVADLDEALVSGDSSLIKKAIEKMGGRDVTDKIIDQLMLIDPSDTKTMNAFLRGLNKPNFGDYIEEIWYNSLLSAYSTVKNLVTNTIAAVLGPIERVVAAGVEAPLAAAQHRARERFLSEAGAEAVGLLSGITMGLRKALHVMQTGTKGEMGKLELRGMEVFGGPLGAAINVPSRMMVAGDALFRSMETQGALNVFAVREASKLGLKGDALATKVAELLANPSSAMLQAAKDVASYRLFQKEPGEIIKSLLRMRDKMPLGRFILPFVQTPVNLVKFGLERTLLGLANPGLREALKAGSPEASDLLGRVILGTGIQAGIASMFGQGYLTGAAPKSQAERERFYNEGKQPYAVRFGDQWVSYQGLEPFNQMFTQVAGLYDAFKDDGTEPDGNEILTFAFQIAQNLSSQTYMEGLSNALNAILEPERYGEQFLNRTASSLIPYSAALRVAARVQSPTIKEPFNLPEQIAANIPFATEAVRPKLDAYGQPIAIEAPLSPYRTSAVKADPIDIELERLGEYPSGTGKIIQGVKLSDQLAYDYKQQATSLQRHGLELLMQNPAYQTMSDVDKKALVNSTMNKAHALAAKNLMLESPLSQAETEEQYERWVESQALYQTYSGVREQVLTKRGLWEQWDNADSTARDKLLKKPQFQQAQAEWTRQREQMRRRNPRLDIALVELGYVAKRINR